MPRRPFLCRSVVWRMRNGSMESCPARRYSDCWQLTVITWCERARTERQTKLSMFCRCTGKATSISSFRERRWVFWLSPSVSVCVFLSTSVSGFFFCLCLVSVCLGVCLYHFFLSVSVCLWIMDPHSRAPKKNTGHGNEVLPQDTKHIMQRPCYQQGSPCQDPAGNWTTQRPPDDHKETQTAVVWSCFPFIRSGQNHFARHSERG